jgi:hypothetical protein
MSADCSDGEILLYLSRFEGPQLGNPLPDAVEVFHRQVEVPQNIQEYFDEAISQVCLQRMAIAFLLLFSNSRLMPDFPIIVLSLLL